MLIVLDLEFTPPRVPSSPCPEIDIERFFKLENPITSERLSIVIAMTQKKAIFGDTLN